MEFWPTLPETAVLLFGGIATGLYGSTVGSGSLLSVPLLYWAGFPTHVVIGTNRFSACMLESASAIRFYRDGILDARLLSLGGLLGVFAGLGAIFGSTLVLELDEQLVNLSVAIFLLLVAALSLKQKKETEQSRELSSARLGVILTLSLALGVYGGYLGAGMGTLLMLLLANTGFSLVRSGAMSRVAGIIWSAAASVVFGLNGKIAFGAALVLSIGFVVGGWIGAGLSARRGDSYVRVLMIAVIVATAIKLVLEGMR